MSLNIMKIFVSNSQFFQDSYHWWKKSRFMSPLYPSHFLWRVWKGTMWRFITTTFMILTVEDNMLMNLIFFSKSLVVLKHGLIFCLRELMVCFAIQCKILPWMENMPAKFVKLWMLISLFFKYSNFIWFSCRNLNIF